MAMKEANPWFTVCSDSPTNRASSSAVTRLSPPPLPPIPPNPPDLTSFPPLPQPTSRQVVHSPSSSSPPRSRLKTLTAPNELISTRSGVRPTTSVETQAIALSGPLTSSLANPIPITGIPQITATNGSVVGTITPILRSDSILGKPANSPPKPSPTPNPPASPSPLNPLPLPQKPSPTPPNTEPTATPPLNDPPPPQQTPLNPPAQPPTSATDPSTAAPTPKMSKPHDTWAERIKRSTDKSLKRLSSTITTTNGTPRVKIPEKVFQKGAEMHRDYVKGYFLGKLPPLGQIQSILNHMWGKGVNLEIHLNHSDYTILVRIPNKFIREKILEKEFWHIGTSLFYVKDWTSASATSTPSFVAIPLWAHVSGIHFHLMHQEGLSYIASLIGVPLEIDDWTLKRTSMSAAHLKIKADVTKPLPTTIESEREDGSILSLDVTYPWLPSVCSHCGKIGHLKNLCPSSTCVWVPVDPENLKTKESSNVNKRKQTQSATCVATAQSPPPLSTTTSATNLPPPKNPPPLLNPSSPPKTNHLQKAKTLLDLLIT